MSFDGKANFAIAPVIVAPIPAVSGLTVTVLASQGSLFTGTPPYNLTVWEPLPPLGQPTKAFAEIVRVSKVEGDTITFSARAQEGTTAKPIGPGWVIADTITVKALTDIEKAVEEGSTGLASEVAARQAGDSTNATAISNEKARAEGAEALKATITALNGETTAREIADNLRLVKAENLKDIGSASTARTNLGLGSSAVEPSSAFDPKGAAGAAEAAASTALATEKGRAETQEGLKLAKAENLKDVSSASTARTNLGLGTAAVEPSTAFDAKGAAASAQTAAEGVTATEKTRAETAEATKASSAALTSETSAREAADATNATAISTEKTRAEGQEVLKAPLASPALTGTPTGPTAIAGTNTTQLASTGFATNAKKEAEEKSDVKGEAAAEKARAEGVEVTKAPLVSPALTGTPTVPTATAGTNTTQAASTAFATTAKGEAESKGTTALNTEKSRAEAAEGEAVKLTGIQTVAGSKTFSSPPIVPTPNAPNDAVSLEYMQGLLEGITPYANVVLATAAALPANAYSAGVLTGVSFGALTIDGTAPVVGQRVLVKNETTEANNGIYTVTHVGAVAELYALTRASDMAAGATVKTGALTYTTAGATNANKGFWVVGLGPFTVATNPLKWEQYLGSQDIVAGEGIQITGNTVAVSSSVVYGSATADYVVMSVGSEIVASPRTGSELPRHAGSAAEVGTIINAALASLNGVGHLHLALGAVLVNDAEVVINGNPGVNPFTPERQLIVTGTGTQLTQETAGKNTLAVKNAATVDVSGFRLKATTEAKSALLLDDTGAQSEMSVIDSRFDVFCTNSSAAYPAVLMRNPFQSTFPKLYALSTKNEGLVIENASTTTNYGNSSFGLVYLFASKEAGRAGMRLTTTTPTKFLDMITVENIQCVHSGYYGVYSLGARSCTFLHVDLENMNFPIWCDGNAEGAETKNMRVLNGYLAPEGENPAITNTEHTGGNYFAATVAAPAGNATVPLKDESRFRTVNKYDLTLENAASANNISVTNPSTQVTLRRIDEGVIAPLGTSRQARTYAANHTLSPNDMGLVVEYNSAAAGSITIAPFAEKALPVGTVIRLCQVGVGQLSIVAGEGVTLREQGEVTFGRYAEAELRCRALNEWVLSPIGGAQGVAGPEGKAGVWVETVLSAKVENAPGYQTPRARSELGGAVCRLRGAVKVKAGEELKANETLLTLPEGLRPPATARVRASGGIELSITATGVVTVSGTVASAVDLWLDGLTFNLT